MAVEAAYLVPHPPVIVPAVGGGREEALSDTARGMAAVAERIAQGGYDPLVYVTPHGPAFLNGLALWDVDCLSGSLRAFGAGETAFTKEIHRELTAAIAAELSRRNLGCVLLDEKTARRYRVRPELDHGVLVPMTFIDAVHPRYRMVHLSAGGLPPLDHYRAGMAVAAAARSLQLRCAVVMSGDMSHCLREDGPYGYDPRGPRFDKAVDDALRAGDLKALLTLPPSLTEPAAECGYRPLQVGLGALDGLRVRPSLLSSEGPFGVGYKTALLETEGPAPSLLPSLEAAVNGRFQALRRREDSYISLARLTVEAFVRHGAPPVWTEVRDRFPEADRLRLEARRSGTFVSLHRGGRLRGCVGTTEPTRPTLAEEIIGNAVSACSRDPRFDPVAANELDDLEIKVDVLFPPEAVGSPEGLDPSRYGVIVSRGTRRGLLLPRLDGVDTVAEQLRIAREKAGISPQEAVRLQRFEVERHEVGDP